MEPIDQPSSKLLHV